jgi:hypothetical protein
LAYKKKKNNEISSLQRKGKRWLKSVKKDGNEQKILSLPQEGKVKAYKIFARKIFESRLW